jgi:hypothetical protein
LVSSRWGTLEAIKSVRCEPIMSTATEVDASVVATDEPGLTERGYMPAE